MLLPAMAKRCPAAIDSALPLGNFVELAVNLDAATARIPGAGNVDV